MNELVFTSNNKQIFYRFILLHLLYLFDLTGYAQKINITATIVNENNEIQPNIIANLLNAKDSSLVKSEWTDQSGFVQFEKIEPHQLLIQIYSIGTKNTFFKVKESNTTNWDQGKLQISNNTLLKEVSVSSQKYYIERKGEKTIINVQNSILSTGSNAFEVLERSPGVLIRSNESISLKGKSGVIIMIDGKITPLAGEDLIQYLKSIPSNNLDKIELVSNPSSKYDAAGNAGIIDIRFKKDKRFGLNGNFISTYGMSKFSKYSSGINLNYRNKKCNVFGSYNISRPTANANFNIHRNFFNTAHDIESIIEQHSEVKAPNLINSPRIGIDYIANDKNIIGILFSGNYTSNNREGISKSTISSPDQQILSATDTKNKLGSKNNIVFGNINYKHIFDTTGQEINVDLDVGNYNSKSLQEFNSNYIDQNNNPLSDDRLNTDQRGIINVQSIKIDYTLPLANKSKLEAGIKSSVVKTENDIKFFHVEHEQLSIDSSNSNHFIYKENVNAAYINLSKELSLNDFQIGLRMENTISNGVQISSKESFNRNYIDFFPSAAWSKKISTNHQFGISYSKRIDRPTYRQLNPFRIFVDPYTYVVGDPALKPVLSHNLTLSYTLNGLYNLELSYEHGKEVITDVFVQDDKTKVSNQIPANLQKLDFINLNISIPYQIKNWYNSSINAGLNWSKYYSPFQGGILNQKYISWNIQHQNNFVINSKGWTAEISEYFQSKMVWGLFTIKSLAQVNAGIQKTSANKNSTIKLSVSDIFFTNHIAVLVKYQNMDFFTNRTWDSRTVNLSYIYRFGKNTIIKSRQRNTGVEDIKKRAS